MPLSGLWDIVPLWLLRSHIRRLWFSYFSVLEFSFKIPLRVFAFHYRAPRRPREDDCANRRPDRSGDSTVSKRLPPTPADPADSCVRPIAPIPSHGPTDEKVRREQSERPTPLSTLYFCHFENKRERRDQVGTRDLYAQSRVRKTSSICRQGVAQTKSSDRSRVQIAALLFRLLRFLSSPLLKEVSLVSPIPIVIEKKHASFIWLEAPLYVFRIPSSMLLERKGTGSRWGTLSVAMDWSRSRSIILLSKMYFST